LSCIRFIVFPFLFVPVFLGSSTRPFPGVVACEEGFPIEVYAVAAVVWKEARSEGVRGRKAVVDAIRNRSVKYKESILETTRRGMKSGKLDPKLVHEAAWMLQGKVGHKFCYWMNRELATDQRQIRIAEKSKKVEIGAHWFF
jgi:hypothetical protein